MYSEHLEALIKAALADGEITEKERSVLYRNATKEGIDIDEFEMVIEARLFEMRKNASHAAQVPPIAPPPPPPAHQAPRPATVKHGEVRKCPSCGAAVSALVAMCPECGHEFVGVKGNATAAALSKMLDEIDAEASEESLKKYVGQLFLGQPNKTTTRKMNLIQNFPVPNDKEDLVELYTMAAANSQIKDDGSIDTYRLREAWTAKARQIRAKAEILFRNDPETLALFKEQKTERKRRFGLF